MNKGYKISGVLMILSLILLALILLKKPKEPTVSIEEHTIVVEYIQAKEMWNQLYEEYIYSHPGLEDGFEDYLKSYYNDFYVDYLLIQKKYKALEIPKYPLGIIGGNTNESYI